MESSFVNKINKFISSNGLLKDGTHVIVGLSGGADSTALLMVLLRLGYKCTAVHCNFHLRGAESDRDEQFVTNLCHNLGVGLEICNYDTTSYAKQKGISIEMAARELRYADFERIMKEQKASAICIAHHRDDSVETLLLNLIRGTGIKGLTGIKPKNGHIIRPLLCVSRQEIEQYLNQTGQSYITDSTNLETDYTRNKIRLELLPLMRRINPSADSSIDLTAQHLQQAYAFYSQAIEQACKDIVTATEDKITVNIDKLKQSPSVQGILFEILSPLGFNDSQITDISESIDSQTGTQFCSATHQILKDRNVFTISPIDNCDFKPVTVNIEPGTIVTLPDGSRLKMNQAPAGTTISANPSVATFDADMLSSGQITVRAWQNGDWFIPFGMKGRKLVSDFLTDCKISVSERKQILVATYGNDIIWVIGHRSDNRYRVSDNTRKQIIIEII